MVPLRKCIILRQLLPRDRLVRVVRTPESRVEIDLTDGRLNGRGAYFLPTEAAILLIRKKRLLDRALKTAVPDNVYCDLERFRIDES